MKIKNVKVGDLLYLKTYGEMKESKYFCYEDHQFQHLHFTTKTTFYSLVLDNTSGGNLVVVNEVCGDNIKYVKPYNSDIIGFLPRHAFRKPTKKELDKYHGGFNYED